MDARRIPFREHFDVVCAFDVLEHIRDDEAVLDEIRLSLRPDAGVVLTFHSTCFCGAPRMKRRSTSVDIKQRNWLPRSGSRLRGDLQDFVRLDSSAAAMAFPPPQPPVRKVRLGSELAVAPALNRCLSAYRR